jgi:nucleotide-binding universal stress UspA family protein
LIVTSDASSDSVHRIVVGVDGSAPSKAALAWAVRQARLTGAVIDAVAAWDFPLAFPTPWPPSLGADFQGMARQVLDEAVADISADAGQVEIRRQVAEGNAAPI